MSVTDELFKLKEERKTGARSSIYFSCIFFSFFDGGLYEIGLGCCVLYSALLGRAEVRNGRRSGRLEGGR